jgi:hypothetical protein
MTRHNGGLDAVATNLRERAAAFCGSSQLLMSSAGATSPAWDRLAEIASLSKADR